MEFQLLINSIFDHFENDGYFLYFIGGASRSIIEKENLPLDIDLSTDAKPIEIINILKKINLGKILFHGVEYGTVFLKYNKLSIEITTTRSDLICYGRDVKVEFCKSFEEDSKRRDFTINAIYINREGDVLDFYSGISDLKEGRVRFIGDAGDRIKEDYLRILRYFRFTTLYDQSLDKKILNICTELKDGLKKLSMERINNEIFKIISYKNYFSGLLNIVNSGVIDFIFPNKNINMEISENKKQNINHIVKFLFFLNNYYGSEAVNILKNVLERKFIVKSGERKQVDFFIKFHGIFENMESLSINEKLIIFDNVKLFQDFDFCYLFNIKIRNKVMNFIKFCRKVDMSIYKEKIKKMKPREIKNFYIERKVELINSINF